MPNITANSITIHYERTGGAKPPLVLLHGLTDTGQCWPRLVSALKHDYNIIAPDARAHGLSQAPETGYSYDIMAADVAGLIQALSLKKTALIGHSMGAMTAALVAAAYPGLVSCLVLEDPPWHETVPSPEQRAVAADGWQTMIRGMQRATPEQLLASATQRNPGIKQWDAVEFAPWREGKQRVSLKIIQLLRTAPLPYQDIVKRISCSTLLVTADTARGAIVTAQLAQQIAAMNKHFAVVTIRSAGHNIRRENFADYRAAVSAFLAAHI
jgi:N-formylmaleamate deformylase